MKTGRRDKRIVFELFDVDTEEWNYYYSCFARVNSSGGNEYFAGGSEQSTSGVVFNVWYTKKLKDLYLNTQIYRIKFKGATFDIQDVDNYMFRNIELNIKAVGRLER